MQTLCAENSKNKQKYTTLIHMNTHAYGPRRAVKTRKNKKCATNLMLE